MSATHVASLGRYVGVFAALLALTALTVWIAFIDLGALNAPAALAIATAKATLVALYFMHLRESTRLTWVVLAAGLLWLGILLALGMSDYVSRGWLPYPGK